MPYWKCTQCHHEFEQITERGKVPLCDWCGAPSFILEEKTPLEKMCEPENMRKLLKEIVAYEKGSNIRKH